MWNNLELLRTLSAGAFWLMTACGGITVLAGIGKYFLDHRIPELEAALELTARQTPPKLDVILGRFESGDYGVAITFENQVPTEAQWMVTTPEGKVLSGIMLEWVKMNPTDERMLFTGKATLDRSEYPTGPVELRFSYRSQYRSEFPGLEELSGRIVKHYQFTDGQLIPLDVPASSDK